LQLPETGAMRSRSCVADRLISQKERPPRGLAAGPPWSKRFVANTRLLWSEPRSQAVQVLPKPCRRLPLRQHQQSSTLPLPSRAATANKVGTTAADQTSRDRGSLATALPAGAFRSPAHYVIGKKSCSAWARRKAIGSKHLTPGTLRSYFRPPPKVIERWCAWGSSAR
jgi:hypothetical protein